MTNAWFPHTRSHMFDVLKFRAGKPSGIFRQWFLAGHEWQKMVHSSCTVLCEDVHETGIVSNHLEWAITTKEVLSKNDLPYFLDCFPRVLFITELRVQFKRENYHYIHTHIASSYVAVFCRHIPDFKTSFLMTTSHGVCCVVREFRVIHTANSNSVKNVRACLTFVPASHVVFRKSGVRFVRLWQNRAQPFYQHGTAISNSSLICH